MASVRFGCQLPQDNPNFDQVIAVAVECERLGFDSVWAYDHLSPFWTSSGRVLECWTLLSAVAARTKRIKIGSLVSNVNLRNPALLAKMTSTLDNISDGRLIVGLGVGDKLSQSELQAYGYKFASTNERVDRLKETIQILKVLWTEDEASFKGKYYQISRAHNYPKPRQQPHPQIWIGGKHRKLLSLVAEMADGWNYWGLKKSELEKRENYLHSQCIEFNRRPEDIVKSWAGTISAVPKIESHVDVVDGVRAELLKQTSDQTDYFIGSFSSNATPEVYTSFAEAVKSIGR